MISDQALASNCRRLIKHYDHNENRISVESRVYDGVRYITFIGQPNEAFRKDYSLFRFMHDILGYSIYDESFYNDNFAGDWIAVKGKVVEGIKKDERIPVCFSGYGVGGAVATIAGYDLLRTMPSIISRVVTFGAPRALNSRKTNNGFTYCLSQITTNYVLPSDKLPKMFRWTKYFSLNNKLLDSDLPGTIDGYVEALGGDSNE